MKKKKSKMRNSKGFDFDDKILWENITDLATSKEELD